MNADDTDLKSQRTTVRTVGFSFQIRVIRVHPRLIGLSVGPTRYRELVLTCTAGVPDLTFRGFHQTQEEGGSPG